MKKQKEDEIVVDEIKKTNVLLEKGFKKQDNIVKKEVDKAFLEVKDTFATSTSLIISALTLVASLAWNDFAKAVFDYFKSSLNKWGELVGLFLYAAIVTLIVVLIVKRLKGVKEKVGGDSIK